MRNATIAMTAAILCACAKSPESIAPSYVSPLTYRGYDCDQLSEEIVRVEEALTVASKQQRDARSNDTIGVLLIGMPVSSISGGNVATQVARLKGEQKTIRQTATEKRCNLPPSIKADAS